MNLKPDLFYKTVFEIDFDKLWNNGIRALLFDIDNTLATYDDICPDERLSAFLLSLKERGFKIFLLSNNKKDRVKIFSEHIGFPFRGRACKPLKFFIKKAIKTLGETAKTTALVGDQIFTDVWGANRLGICSVLVSPISEKEDKFVAFKRKFEKYFTKNI